MKARIFGAVAALCFFATAHAQIVYTSQGAGVSASTIAQDDQGSVVASDAQSHSSSSLANYNHSAGASINVDPFSAFPFASATTTLGGDQFTLTGHADANVNTGSFENYPNGASLFANASAGASLQFHVATDAMGHLNATVSRNEGSAGGSFSFYEDGNLIFSGDAFSGTTSEDYFFQAASLYEVDVNCGAGASVFEEFAFKAGSADYRVSVTGVPEPTTFLAFGPCLLLLRRRR